MIPLAIKRDFPIFRHHAGLAFLDNAATTQKPQVVIDTEQELYEKFYANVHRAVYDLAAESTQRYEGSRQIIADFIQARSPEEIIFTRNATEALNLAAWIESAKLAAGDEIIISVAEHHSNLLPWQRLTREKGAVLKWVELDQEQKFDLKNFTSQVSPRTKIVATAWVSNVLGYVAPLVEIVKAAHRVGAVVVVDAAQSASHLPVNVQALDADYMAFSGHKMYGPTGVGFLYAKQALVSEAEPLMVGGGTIKQVTRQAALWNKSPWRFEGGTPPIAQVVALGAAIQYLKKIGMAEIWQHDLRLAAYAWQKLSAVEGLRIYGPPVSDQRAAVISFALFASRQALHSHDVSQLVNEHMIAIRGGHHCAQPLMETLGVAELNRASFGIYNTGEEIDRLAEALNQARSRLGGN